MEDKNRKIAENEQSARANLIVVMLKGIFYTEKGIPMNSGPVEMGRQNRRTLGVRDCSQTKSGTLTRVASATPTPPSCLRKPCAVQKVPACTSPSISHLIEVAFPKPIIMLAANKAVT